MTEVYLTFGLLAIFFILMSVRLLFLKGGEFKGTCASQSPFLREEGATCSYCGKVVGEEECGKDEVDNSTLGESEVTKVMSKFD